MAKTNAIRMVEQAGIPYREAFYSSDTSDWNGLHAAQAIGFPPEQVFKTLVARGRASWFFVFRSAVSWISKRQPRLLTTNG